MRKLAGAYYEIGLALGSELDWSEALAEQVGSPAFARRCRDLAGELWPPAVEKFEGVLHGLGVSADQVISWYFTRGSEIGCTCFAIAPELTAEGEPLVGRDYHWFHFARKWCEARRVAPTGAEAAVGYTHSLLGMPDAVNAAGLAVFLSSLPPEPASRPGLTWHIITERCLHEARSACDAISWMSQVPHLRAFSYLVVDASGDMAVVEAGPDRVDVRGPEEGLLVATNWPKLRPVKRPLHELATRQQEAERLVRSHFGGGRAGVTDVRELVTSHEGPFCAGPHPREGEAGFHDDDWRTLWGAYVRPARRELFVASGLPCRSEFVKYQVRA